MKKTVITLISFLAILSIFGAAWYYINYQKYAPTTYVTDTPMGSITTDTKTGVVSTSTPVYSVTDITTHNDATSCYSIISGSVYDLTQWVNMHPGGTDAILSMCGIDGTEKFMNKHQGKPKFMTILSRYKVGVLK